MAARRRRSRRGLGDSADQAFTTFRIARVKAEKGDCVSALDWLTQGYEQRGAARGGSTRSRDESLAAIRAIRSKCFR
jgi:hypothetical protein